jgi:inosine-uridine nucleoside N-ribohydrolase
MVKVHLDTDLGGDIDDLCALAMLLKWPGVEIAGITSVGDNKGKRAGYIKYALKVAGRQDIPVKAGADVSLGCYRMKLGLPKEEDYWPEPVPPVENSLNEALDLMKKNIEDGALIIGIGPFTNFYLLDQKYPGILKQAKLYLMGGYIYPPREGYPNWRHNMDFNIQVDINSAKHVLENSSPLFIPLTVTIETFLRRAYLNKLRSAGPLEKLLAHQAEEFAREHKNEETYGKTCAKLPEDIINFQHDPLAVAIALGWREGIKTEKLPLKFKIKDSWLIEKIDSSGKPFEVVTQIDGDKFSNYWIDQVV